MKTNSILILVAVALALWMFNKERAVENFGGTAQGTFIQLGAGSGYYPYYRYGAGYQWPYWRYLPAIPEYGQHTNYPKASGFYNFYGGNYGLQ